MYDTLTFGVRWLTALVLLSVALALAYVAIIISLCAAHINPKDSNMELKKYLMPNRPATAN